MHVGLPVYCNLQTYRRCQLGNGMSFIFMRGETGDSVGGRIRHTHSDVTTVTVV